MKCSKCNGVMMEKLIVIYRVPARQDGETWAGYGLPFDADKYYVDTESDGFECNKCGHYSTRGITSDRVGCLYCRFMPNEDTEFCTIHSERIFDPYGNHCKHFRKK